MLFRTVAAVVVCACAASTAMAVVVGHGEISMVDSLPQATMDAIGHQKWLFTHASVGWNLLDGLSYLRASNPVRYQLVVSSAGYNGGTQAAYPPPSPTATGTVYECDRGNPGWPGKFTVFANSVGLAGWHCPAVDVAMDKLCYIDQDADVEVYLASMADLEASNPDTVFVYMTIPLTSGEDDANLLRNQYNAAVRYFCATYGKMLFDIADMEAYDPAGNPCTFTLQGQVCQKMYNGYTYDGGHLNEAGCRRMATGWYAIAAFIAMRYVHGDLNGDGRCDAEDFEIFDWCNSGPANLHNGSITCWSVDFDRDQDVDQADFGVFQRCLNGALPANPACDE